MSPAQLIARVTRRGRRPRRPHAECIEASSRARRSARTQDTVSASVFALGGYAAIAVLYSDLGISWCCWRAIGRAEERFRQGALHPLGNCDSKSASTCGVADFDRRDTSTRILLALMDPVRSRAIATVTDGSML